MACFPSAPLPDDGIEAEAVLDGFEREGVDVDALAEQLQREGAGRPRSPGGPGGDDRLQRAALAGASVGDLAAARWPTPPA